MANPARVLHPDGFHGSRAVRAAGSPGTEGGRGRSPLPSTDEEPEDAPLRAHGRAPRHSVGRSFFEGWYVKLVSADRVTRLAVIPGVFVSEDGSLAESFVQVLDGATGSTRYHRFELGEFHADERRFDVRVGANRFSDRGVHLELPDLAGDVTFGPRTRWPVTLAAPGAMGWYAWVPTMECYHGVVSLDHSLAGWVDLGAGRVDLGGGRGFLEKDWGTAFPEAYVWAQSNHFEVPGASFVGSTALIPWRRSAFRGSLVGLHVPGGPGRGLHRFASYTGARIEWLSVDDVHVRWSMVARDGRRLEVAAAVGGRTAGLLHAPVRTQMHQRVAETLDGEVAVLLLDPRGRTLFQGTGGCAGVEVHGPMDRLLSTPSKVRPGFDSVVRTWTAAGGRLAPRWGERARQRRIGGRMGKAEDIIEALGGADNIEEIEACATRLRTVVSNPAIVDEKALKAAGAFGVLSAGSVLQVIVGGEADGLAMDINDIIG